MVRVGRRFARLAGAAVARRLDAEGYAIVPGLLTAAECDALARTFADDRRFRTTVDMARHRFGVGRYRYFAEPLPPLVAALRAHAYRALAPIANRWMEALGLPDRFPQTLPAFRALCAARGQRRPTPLLLRYEAGGYNCLHQDLYGPIFFPLQLTCLLSRPGVDFRGGELLLVEQRPRTQARGIVLPLGQGDGAIFPTRWRPVAAARGIARVTVRHGVSPLVAGVRTALGVIFHDAA